MSEPPPVAGAPAGGSTPPGTVLAAAILLYIGGGLTALSGLAATASLAMLVYLPIGLLFAGLGWAVQRGLPWARIAVLVLSGIGGAIALLRMAWSPIGGLASLVWPVVYIILLSTHSARSWFRRPR